MHRELAGLSEGLSAAFIRALERLLSSVDVSVFFQVLRKCEFLEANDASELLGRLMSSNMSSKRESGCELLITFGVVAFVWSFHCFGKVSCSCCGAGIKFNYKVEV